MLNYDELLQSKLDELDRGEPLDQVIASLPAEAEDLADLLRLATAVRAIQHPEPLLETVQLQRHQIRAAAEARTQPLNNHNTRPIEPTIHARPRNWNWKWLGGAAVFAAAGAFVFLCAALAAFGFWLRDRNIDTAQVASITGQVQVSDSTGAAWENLEPGDRIRQGQRVRTLGASAALLVYPEGTRTELSASSDVTFSHLNVSGSSLQVELSQNGGETSHQVVPFQSDSSFFRVHTPSGTAEVHGTLFAVRVGAGGQAQFAVSTGEVRVQNDGQEVVLTAGQASAGIPGGTLTEPSFLFHLQGSLMDMDDETGVWLVSGTEFQVTEDTIIAGSPAIGSVVSVSGRLLVDGTRLADIIEPAADLEQIAFFTGRIESMDDVWVIGGSEVMVTSETILDPDLQVGLPVQVTFNTLEDGTWLAIRIESLVQDPDEPTPTVTASATADPNAMPSYEFQPDELVAASCDQNPSEYRLTGTLRNTATDAKDYAAHLELGYRIDAGGEYLSAVELIPTGWERIEAGQTVTFSIRVRMTDDWDAVDEGTEVKLRIYIASTTNRPDHTNGQLTVTIAAGCQEEATPTFTQTPTPTGTLVTETPTVTPADVTPTAQPTVALEGAVQCTGANPHPTGMKLAQRYGVPYEEIMRWFCSGYGFGEIDLAYSLSRESGKPVEEIFAMRASGLGWGQIKKQVHDLDSDGNHEDDDDDNGKKDKDKDKKDKKDKKNNKKP